MKIYITIFILLLCNTAYSQVVDTVLLRVQYKSSFRRVLEDKDNSKDVHLLDIGKSCSHFYSQKFAIFKHQADSVKRTINDPLEYLYFLGEMSDKSGQAYSIWKNKPYKDQYVYTDIVANDYYFFYIDNIDFPEWILEDQERTIAGFSCHKAVCTYRGRKWTAYYTLDIPFNNGPWLFGGLPGLILSACDEQGYFSFECVGIEQKKNQKIPMCLNLNLYEKTTHKDFIRLLKDYWSDQFNTINKLQGLPYGEAPSAQRVFTSCFIDNEE